MKQCITSDFQVAHGEWYTKDGNNGNRDSKCNHNVLLKRVFQDLTEFTPISSTNLWRTLENRIFSGVFYVLLRLTCPPETNQLSTNEEGDH